MNAIKESLEDLSLKYQGEEDAIKETEEEKRSLDEEEFASAEFKEIEDAIKREENLEEQKFMKDKILNTEVPIKALYGHGSKDIPIDLKYNNNDTGINLVTTTKWGSTQSKYVSLFLSYGLMASEIQLNLKRAVAELIDRSIFEYFWLSESFFKLITQEFNKDYSSEPMIKLAIKDFLNNNLIYNEIFNEDYEELEKLNRKCNNAVSIHEIKSIKYDLVKIIEEYLINKKNYGFLKVQLNKFVRTHISLLKEILCFEIRIYRGYQTNNIPSINIFFDAVNLCQNEIVKRDKKFRRADISNENKKYLNLPSGIIDPNFDTWNLIDSPCTIHTTLQYSEFPKRHHDLKYKLDEFINVYNETIDNQIQIIVAFICGTINEDDNLRPPKLTARQVSDGKQAGNIYRKYNINNYQHANMYVNDSKNHQSGNDLENHHLQSNTYFSKYYINNQNDYSIDIYKNKYYKYKKKYLKLKQKLI